MVTLKSPTDRRQNLLILMCWLIYTTAYFGRYSYNSNINLIMADYGVDHAQAGLVTTFFFFGYGVGQFINGWLCDKYNKHFLFPLVLILSSGLNMALYLQVPFASVKFLWLANALLQSCLWSSLISLVSKFLDAEHRQRAIIVLSTTASVGTFLTYFLSALFVKLNNFRLSFAFGACVMTVVAVLWLVFFPALKTLPVQDKIPDVPGTVDKNGKTHLPRIMVFMVISLGCFAVIHNFIKDGLQTWVPSILKEVHGLSDSLSIVLSLVLPLLGIFGAVFSVTIQKKIRDLVCLCGAFISLSVGFLLLIMFELRNSVVITLICFGIIVLVMHAINNIVTSIAPIQLRDCFNSGRMAGTMNACCYIGSTISSYALGVIADHWGWDSVFVIFLVAALALVALSGIYTVCRYLPHKGKQSL